MKDFRITHAKIILKTYSVTPIRGLRPTSVLLTGEGFDKATEVFYNGIEATEFIISSPNRMVVRVPKSQVGREVTSVSVVSTTTPSGSLSSVAFELTKPPKKIEGIDRLIQSWLMVFLTSPGSDIFNKRSGGGAGSLIGRPTDRQNKGIAADLAQAIERTQQELTRLQAGNQRIPPEEKLLSSTLESLSYDENSTTLSAQVLIQSMAGDSAQIGVG